MKLYFEHCYVAGWTIQAEAIPARGFLVSVYTGENELRLVDSFYVADRATARRAFRSLKRHHETKGLTPESVDKARRLYALDT